MQRTIVISTYATASKDLISSLSSGQYATVYNLLSFAIASLLFTSLFLLLVQGRVAPRYRNALIVSATVCGIATYHYFRIFSNFKESYPAGSTVDSAHALSAVQFNEGYRYVDWFLTVPLLLVETVAVLALTRAASRHLLIRLVPASALMIALGYPGEITLSTGPRIIWGVLATLPFIYLIYVLFVELTRALDGKTAEVRRQISTLRVLLIGSWMVYPIAFAFPLLGGTFFSGASGFVLRQGGYSIADVLAKALFGLLIFRLARTQSILDEPLIYGDAEDVHGAEPRAVPGARKAT
ncbi:bacteriorhodopsin-like [Aeromicrobium sp.]|uniref:bacteriorhodopsin-like n=1 Tax=Aeromicrobium sp. TaxID=1871063 RepID=UPI0019997D57|nr:bacteriorhodopsin-like [Aeromicrobium sp.]MBC7630770.1 bacteriorhodopsin [Aeromicrobium sp.]